MPLFCSFSPIRQALLREKTNNGLTEAMSDDWDAVVGRAKGLWAPKWRTATRWTTLRESRAAREKAEGGSTTPPPAQQEGAETEPAGSGSPSTSFRVVDVSAVRSRLAQMGDVSRMVDKTSSSLKSRLIVPHPAPVPPASDGAGSTADAIPVEVEESRGEGEAEEEAMELVDEMPLPELYIPGTVVHIYSVMGTYRAALVARDHPSLRRIEMMGNMMADHKANNYFEALTEVHDVNQARSAGRMPAAWVPFDVSQTCQLCKSCFSWHSTAQSVAQKNRDKHNCRTCGALVCGPCSSHKKPVPDIGLNLPVRVCDRCYFRGVTIER